jgi:CheY-like chemotaxis protein
MGNKKIIIVEDEGLVALKIKKDVERMGYDVVNIFASGEEALTGVEAVLPDLVLMDIKLQGRMDGIKTANHISRNMIFL